MVRDTSRVGWLAALILAMLVWGEPTLHAQTVQLPARDQALTGEPALVYAVGVADGADHEMLGQVAGVAFDDDGNLFILDRGSHRVVVYGADGGFLRMFGQRGGGPGELQAPMSIMVTGNEVVILDPAKPAAVIFRRDGTFIREVRFEPEDRPGPRLERHPRGGFVYELMPLMMGMGRAGGGMPEIQQRETIPIVWRGTVPGTNTRTLYEAPAPELNVQQEVRPQQGGTRVVMRTAGRPVFEPTLRWSVQPDGGVAVVGSEHYRVELVGADGRIARTLERAIAPRPVADRDRERARAVREAAIASGTGLTGAVAGGGGAGPGRAQMEGMARQMASEMTFAETIPVIQALAADPTGRLWIRRAGDRIYDRGPVDLLTVDGRYLGTLPEGTRIPNAFGPNNLAAYIEEDDLGVPRVAVRRLPDWR